jgi:hypothetical protein
MDDTAIPVVFPAYLISVPRPGIDLPAIVNGWGVRDIPAGTERVRDLGHAGILFIRGSDGITKYYEYGRYDSANLGLVRNRPVPNLVLSRGRYTLTDLGRVLRRVSGSAGQRGLVKGVMIAAPGRFKTMLDYAEKRRAENANPSRPPYNLFLNSCLHFAKQVVEAAGVDMPAVLDPRPLGYMERLEAHYPDVHYDPRLKAVTIEGGIPK